MQEMIKTTDPDDISGWVAELSNYSGNSIGEKLLHRAIVLKRFRDQVLEGAALELEAMQGSTRSVYADRIRKQKWAHHD